ncbi:glycerol-3-phosphate 1-O-acyltransferase PlsY [Terriglobus roseus]|uniref:Glycerol-3-phosphate acyltransferase n=1 Tax=Terriglobus roseus TaxID=392734 RepID=A0A1H4KJ80_9BACT|nr:glycerol-3-phosphate 1-O-acyltransferase PlsY [Terriglobus roseus]SEB58453.1 acyl-phosphate glycerol-3-phosphate acyltransferase [Terriglobus roseus]
MTPLLLWIITLAVAYLIGSIPTGYLLVRTFRNEDIRETGSGNIGATNVARSGAKGLGIATLVLDALKGALAVVIAQHMAQATGFPNGYSLEAVAGLFAVLGHVFPVWLGFRGGKGVATAAGVFAAMMPLTTLICVGIFAVVFMLTRYVSLASIVGAISLAVLCIVFDSRRQPIVDLVYLAMPVLVIAKHHGNISRLLAHTEPKFGTKPTA